MTPNTIQILGNLLLGGSLTLGNSVPDLPSEVTPGTMLICDNTLYYGAVVGGVNVWFPLVRNLPSTYVQYQGAASTTWLVQHNLNCSLQQLMYQITDQNGTLQSPSGVTAIDDNSFSLTFTESIMGSVVVIGAVELSGTDATLESINVGALNQVVLDATGIQMASGTSIDIGGDAVVTVSQMNAAIANAIANLESSSYSIPG